MKAVQLPRGRSLPTGTVTFLFTDIEGSTKLVQALGDRYAEVLSTHRQIVRSAIEREGGTEVGTEGDSVFAVFPTAAAGIAATATAQRAIDAAAWPAGTHVRVRMGLHTGEGRLGGENYIGLDVTGTRSLTSGTGVVLGVAGSGIGNTIGGTTAAARNVISGNPTNGVQISGSGTTGNKVQGNYIGPKADGTGGLSSQTGVRIDTGAAGNQQRLRGGTNFGGSPRKEGAPRQSSQAARRMAAALRESGRFRTGRGRATHAAQRRGVLCRARAHHGDRDGAVRDRCHPPPTGGHRPTGPGHGH